MVTVLLRILLVVGLLVSAATADIARADANDGIVRPRIFKKAKHVEFAPLISYVANDPWVRGLIPNASLTYFYSEHSGIEITGGYGIYVNKRIIGLMENEIERRPRFISRPRTFVTLNYTWSPVYGKLSFLGEVLMHHDLSIVVGGGFAQDEVESHLLTNGVLVPAFTNFFVPVADFGIGERFFFGPRTALRLNLRPYIFFENINDDPGLNVDVHISLGVTFLM